MAVAEFKAWISTRESRKASEPKKRSALFARTLAILKGNGTMPSILKRRAFIARHFAQYKRDPTNKRRYAIRNWGFALSKNINERVTVRVK